MAIRLAPRMDERRRRWQKTVWVETRGNRAMNSGGMQ
jgi:hypothetical protein